MEIGNIVLTILLLICNYKVTMNFLSIYEGKSSLQELIILPICIIALWISIINRNSYNILIEICMIYIINFIGQIIAFIIKFIQFEKLDY